MTKAIGWLMQASVLLLIYRPTNSLYTCELPILNSIVDGRLCFAFAKDIVAN